jgi:hypothetical protein
LHLSGKLAEVPISCGKIIEETSSSENIAWEKVGTYNIYE